MGHSALEQADPPPVRGGNGAGPLDPEDYRLLQTVSIINLTLSALAFLALIILTIISCYDLFANPNGSLAKEEGACLLLMCLCMATEALLTSWLTAKLANH